MKQIAEPGNYNNPLFVYNPAAGIRNREYVMRSFHRACQRYGWQGWIHETNEGEDITRIIREYIVRGCDVVFAGGGDGTISAVVTALVGTSIPLAIIPLGTGNLLANQLRIPLQIHQAFAYIKRETTFRYLNALHIHDRYAVLNASIGFSSGLVENTSRQEKRRFGILAYAWRGLQILIGIQPYRFHLVVDGKQYSIRASEVYITDPMLLAEEIFLKNLPPEAYQSPFGVFIVRARTLRDYLALIIDVVQGKAAKSPRIIHLPVNRAIKILTAKPMAIQADGEVVCQTPVTVEIHPKAIALLIPSSAEKSNIPYYLRMLKEKQ